VPQEGTPYVAAGTEYRFADIACVRAGYKTEKELESKSRINLGMGVCWKDYGIDYTYVPFDDLGDTHRFSVIAKFGKKKASLRKKVRINKNKLKGLIEEKAVLIDTIDKEEKISVPESTGSDIGTILGKDSDLIEILEEKDGIIILSDKGINFNNCSIDVKDEFYQALDRIIDILNIMTEYKVEIKTYKGYLDRLSKKRAGSILNYFIKSGIETDRIIYKPSFERAHTRLDH
jgi:outer membrane protein OmpA-like peptidoglycan-associated protein